ncbi:hypothetical protein N0V88_001855 [Collariella sp. IMI 366227]|nr:hypothetical protein N0V88_001855 [Collariella sp. IMI 366227]
MSLNGLDDPIVKEAHEAAVAEAGGWFLLKYATRDEVELLGRGNGGIVEVRNNIAQYEEKSPLYGFLRYRRRNVIIKYLPEDCSRLIQARVTVHFNAVCDRFAPYDTTFSIADSKELKDTKLSAACSLHAASGSTSSSTSSLRRRRLMEIAEEEEEEERGRKRQSIVKEDDRSKLPTAPGSEPPVRLDADLATSPEASHFTNELEPPQFTGAARPSSPTKSFDDARRMSSQSSRTDLYSLSSYPYSKPRVKLGPRPSADLAGRPRSSAGPAHRPVATVPAGLKSMSKGSKKGRSHAPGHEDEGPESPVREQTEETFSLFEADEADDTPAQPNNNEFAQQQPSSEASAVPSLSHLMPALAPLPPTKQNTMTPEKARLLKAMKLREKKKLISVQSNLGIPAPDIPSEPSTPGLPDEQQEQEALDDVAPVDKAANETDGQEDVSLAISAADSAVDFGTDQASVKTRTDSDPPSPVIPLGTGRTTKASSLAESKDDRVSAQNRGLDYGAENGHRDQEVDLETTPLVEVSGSQNRESQATITAGGAEELISESLDADTPVVQVVSEHLLSPEEPASSTEPNEDANEAASTQAPGQLAAITDASESKPTDAFAAEEISEPSLIRLPTSRFSTQEVRSSTSPANPPIPSIVAPATEKDVEKVEAASTDTKRRKLPGPIRTDLGAPENNKRRSVVSITDNDGLMDELQSATVQQATPITVSKSPISPFFSQDQNSNKASSVTDPAAYRFSRTVSNPVRNSFLAPGEASSVPARSASSGPFLLQKISQQQAAERPKSSAKMGSSISQRIKALEKLSGSVGGGDGSPKERPSSAFFAVRKVNTREASRSPSVIDRTGVATPTPPASRDSSPETTAKALGRGRAGSLVNRMSMFEGGMAPRGRPESVQVRARIIRDPNQPFPKALEVKAGSTDYVPLDLKRSPLVVDVQNRSPSPTTSVRTSRELAHQARQTVLERRQSRQSQDGNKENVPIESQHTADGPRPRRRSSLSVVKDFIKDRTDSFISTKSGSTDNLTNSLSPAAAPAIPSKSPSRPSSIHQPSSLARRLSISSRRSSIEQPAPTPGLSTAQTWSSGTKLEAEAKNNSFSDKKSGSTSSGSSSPDPKGSRASRFMRRISSTLTPSRKTATPSISPTVAEEDAAEVEAASRGSTATNAAAQAPPSIVAFMGDVNVQFPDNLLWKRRSVCLDSHGFLILSAAQGSAMMSFKDRQGAIVKRYHMSDFKPPFAPDVELQELPNSVVLDLIDGSGLQMACEDRNGQMSILRVLEDAHRSHTNFGH